MKVVITSLERKAVLQVPDELFDYIVYICMTAGYEYVSNDHVEIRVPTDRELEYLVSELETLGR